ncbi:MAG TPA: hypothetical protein VFK85_10515 [Anaeromyxobacteraceae bacterium]|nr:hypothetical protein [Anaeromyxobacteraceae bacterium]
MGPASPAPSPPAQRAPDAPASFQDEAAPADDPFARAAAAAPERPLPDLALEETERAERLVRSRPEPSVASRDPGLLDFGDVDLTGPDIFDARQPSLDAQARPEAARASEGSDDPLAGFSLDLGAPVEPAASSTSMLPPPVDAPPLQAPPPAPKPPVPAAPAAATEPEPDAVAADAERSRRRLRAVGMNALSLVALLALAVVLFQVWRGRQHDELAAGARDPAAALDVSSAPYENAAGKPVVVVRGRVRAAEPLRRVEVQVELLDGGRAVASGTVLAGAVPSPEQIHAVVGRAEAEQLRDELASRAPARIAAGELLPFAAVVPDPPQDLRRIEVRVSLRTEALPP